MTQGGRGLEKKMTKCGTRGRRVFKMCHFGSDVLFRMIPRGTFCAAFFMSVFADNIISFFRTIKLCISKQI